MVNIKNKVKFDCDVVIIGAGPAGSGLAYHLAKAGIKVIVVEAEKFPRDKVCGDGVSPIALAELHKMGITHTDKFAKANEIEQVGLFIRKDKVFVNLSKPDHLPHHARIIPRIELDQWIFEAAIKAGAEYFEATRFQQYNINADGVVSTLKQNKKTITLTSKVIVGADGSRSTVARQLHGIKPSSQFQLLGLRAYYNNVDGPNNRVDIYFSQESFPGIYWMFPKGTNGANIGMAMVSETFPQSPLHVRDLLKQHINNNPDIVKRIGNGLLDGKIEGWPITFFNASRSITDYRVLLVGDAAGLINPLSGDGIQYALLSARWASDTLINCLSKNNFSASTIYLYRKKVDEELAYDFAFSNFLVQFARNKALSPLWMEIIATLIARAKIDKNYADIVAGIFEGTYPSYKALTLDFILKSLMQGGVHGMGAILNIAGNPSHAAITGSNIIKSFSSIIDALKDNPMEQAQWLGSIIKNGAKVAGYTVGHTIRSKPA